MRGIAEESIGSIVRTILAALSGYLVQQALISEAQSQQFMIAAVPFLSALIWSLYQKYKGRVRLMTALASPMPMSENTLEKVVATGNTPSVATPQFLVPRAPAPIVPKPPDAA